MKHNVATAVLEERVGAIATRVGDLVNVTAAMNEKVDRIIGLEVKQSELHSDIRQVMVRQDRLADDLNGVGRRLSVVEEVQGTHKRHFRIIAGFIGGTFTAGVALMAWLADKLYTGIIDAIAASSGMK